MKRSVLLMAAMAGVSGLAAGSASAGLISTYELTGGSLVATDADAGDGITVSDLVVGTGYGDLFDNGSDGDSFRFSGDDTQNGTGSALSNDAFLSFTVTNNSGAALVLAAIEATYQATNAFQYSNGRLFSNVQGTDEVLNDTIGQIGRTSGGSDAAPVVDTVDLTAASTEFGANVSAGDFTIADGTSITFTLSFIDGSSSASRFTDLDDIKVIAVPEPGSLALLAIGGLCMVRRRR